MSTPDWSPDQVIVAVVDAIADAKGVDQSELELVLRDYVEVDALEMLATHPDSSWTLEFEIPERKVTVTSDGVVIVDDIVRKI